MTVEMFGDNAPYIRVQVNGIDHVNSANGLYDVEECAANVAKRLAKALAAMSGDKDKPLIERQLQARELTRFATSVELLCHPLQRVDNGVPRFDDSIRRDTF